MENTNVDDIVRITSDGKVVNFLAGSGKQEISLDSKHYKGFVEAWVGDIRAALLVLPSAYNVGESGQFDEEK